MAPIKRAAGEGYDSLWYVDAPYPDTKEQQLKEIDRCLKLLGRAVELLETERDRVAEAMGD